MAHEFETGFFVTQPAWHGLGNVLDAPPTTKDAIIQAGLDWPVVQCPLSLTRPLMNADSFNEPNANISVDVVDTHKANVRQTDGALLGIVGNDFTPLQNVEAFQWFDPLVESGEITLEAAGSLRGGKRVWVLAKIKDATLEVVPGDEISTYLLLAHGHDGTLAIRAGFTDIRVVCQNTLSAAVEAGDRLFKIKHTKGALVSLEAARAIFDVRRGQLRARKDLFQAMAHKTCPDDMMLRYAREVLHEGAGEDEKIVVRNVPEIVEMFEAGRGAKFGRGTMWGAFNAVTEYITHSRGRTSDARVDSNWFGPGAALLGRALTVAEVFINKH